MLTFAAGSAQISSAVAQQALEGPSVFMADESGTSVATSADALIARAQEQGQVRIIVGVGASFAPEGGRSADAVAGQRAGIAAAQKELLNGLDAPTNVRAFETIPYIAVTVSASDLSKIMQARGVTFIQEDTAVPPSLADSVPHVEANKLWRRGFTGTGIGIAVLDTGVRTNHAAFKVSRRSKIVGSACFSSNTTAPNNGGSSTVCPNGREKQVSNTDGSAGKACKKRIEGCDHGTHVASIAAGSQRRNDGVAKESDIYAVQVFSRFSGRAQCRLRRTKCVKSFVSDQILGLEQVLKWVNRGKNISVVNMSLGGGLYDGHCDTQQAARKAAIDNLLSKDVATIIASGNDHRNGFLSAPGCISSAVTAGSTILADQVSDFSNHDQAIDLLAPGTDIKAASQSGPKNATAVLSGTSMASPHIAGAFALLKSAMPNATPHEIERALKCTGVQIARDSTPRPRISIKTAYDYLKNPDTQKNISFNSSTDLSEWTEILGSWFRAGNKLSVRATTGQFWYVAQTPFCANDIRVTAEMTRADPGEECYNSGILLSSNASSNAKMTHLEFTYAICEDDNGENPVTFVDLWSVEKWDGLTHSGITLQLCGNMYPGKPKGARHELVAEKRGNDLVFKIDGQTVCTAQTDARFTEGRAGLIMSAPEDPAHRLDVHSVKLKALPQSTTISSTGEIAQSVDLVDRSAYTVTRQGVTRN